MLPPFSSLMFDDIKITCNETPMGLTLPNDREPFEHAGLTFVPTYSRTGEIQHWTTDCKNLRFKVTQSSTTVQNSLHKYAHGVNFTDFSFTEVCKTVNELSDFLEWDSSQIEVKKLAFGVNITSTVEEWRKFEEHKGTPFYPMRHKNRVYGAKCYHADYAIKGYNKTTETQIHYSSKLDDVIQRYEIEIGRMRSITNRKKAIPIYTLADMKEPCLAAELSLYYLDILKSITWKMGIDISEKLEISPMELAIVKAMPNEDFRSYIKTYHPETYKKYRKMVKKAAGVLNGSQKDEFMHQVGGKLNELLNS